MKTKWMFCFFVDSITVRKSSNIVLYFDKNRFVEVHLLINLLEWIKEKWMTWQVGACTFKSSLSFLQHNILSAILKSQDGGVQKNSIAKMHWLRREFNIDPDNEDIISQNLHISFDTNKMNYVLYTAYQECNAIYWM